MRAVALQATAICSTLLVSPTCLAQAGSGTSVVSQINSNDMTGLLGGNVVILPDTGGQHELKLPVSGPVQRLRTRKGADITLRIFGSKAEELHLHGYDIKLKLKPGETGVMTLKANRSGRFELETHSGHRTVLILEILP